MPGAAGCSGLRDLRELHRVAEQHERARRRAHRERVRERDLAGLVDEEVVERAVELAPARTATPCRRAGGPPRRRSRLSPSSRSARPRRSGRSFFSPTSLQPAASAAASTSRRRLWIALWLVRRRRRPACRGRAGGRSGARRCTSCPSRAAPARRGAGPRRARRARCISSSVETCTRAPCERRVAVQDALRRATAIASSERPIRSSARAGRGVERPAGNERPRQRPLVDAGPRRTASRASVVELHDRPRACPVNGSPTASPASSRCCWTGNAKPGRRVAASSHDPSARDRRSPPRPRSALGRSARAGRRRPTSAGLASRRW